ncbi:MAG: hypothetical protein OHK0053_19920 [Microscillaceae bacterium]
MPAVWGQDTLSPPPSLRVEADSSRPARSAWRLQDARISLDIVPPLKRWLSPDIRQTEAGLELLFENGWLAIVEGGGGRIERKGSDFNYESRGIFLRAGLDFNLWQANKSGAGGLWTLGFKYGWAGFEQSLDYSLPPGYWSSETGRIENKGLQAHWLVLQSRLQAQLFRGFFLGPLVRLHLLIQAPELAETELNSIPGFGLRRGGRIEIGYQLVYRFWQKSGKNKNQKQEP